MKSILKFEDRVEIHDTAYDAFSEETITVLLNRFYDVVDYACHQIVEDGFSYDGFGGGYEPCTTLELLDEDDQKLKKLFRKGYKLIDGVANDGILTVNVDDFNYILGAN